MKKILIILLSLFSFFSYSQTWEECSDSIYSLIQSGNWEDAYKLIEITDNLLVTDSFTFSEKHYIVRELIRSRIKESRLKLAKKN